MGRTRSTRAGSPLAGAARTAALGLFGAVGGWIAYSRFAIDHRAPLLPAIDAEQERFVGQETRFLTAYVDRAGDGAPVVFVHSINAGASSYELRPLFAAVRGRRPAFALDLPGFGLSERADRVYSPALYAEAILDLLRRKVDAPAHVVALSLGSEFAALAALAEPERFRSLTLISPTGFNRRGEKRASQAASDSGTSPVLYRAFAFPLWAQAFYDLLATRASLRYFLSLSFVGPVDAGLLEYAYLTTHQPGARHAPLYFVSGQLFTPDIKPRAYDRLELPVLAVYDQDAYTNFETLPDTLARRANWRAERVQPTRGLPQFEQTEATVRALESFWAGVEA